MISRTSRSGAPQDERGDREREDRVEPPEVRAGAPSRPRRRGSRPTRPCRRATCRNAERALSAVLVVQEPEDREVRREADGGDDRHEPEVDGVTARAEPLDRLPADPPGEDEERADVDLRGEHLRAPVAERPLVVRRARREVGGDERDAERAGVGEHVARVRDEGEGARDDPADGLGDHDGRREREGPREPAQARARPVRGALVLRGVVVPLRAAARGAVSMRVAVRAGAVGVAVRHSLEPPSGAVYGS